MIKFELINSEGCFFAKCEATNFKNARDFFSLDFEGKFIIVNEFGERKNVRL